MDLVAASDLPAGAEVCVRYGGETPGDLLVDYGFADSRAPPLASLEFEIDEVRKGRLQPHALHGT